jgi:CheY-like chemotaxis protein
MLDTNKTRAQLIQELGDLRRSLAEQSRANLLLGNSRIVATKRFAAGIAHEINNPLGIISGFAELTLLNTDLPQPVLDDLRVIHSECNRAARVLHDLLSFAGERPVATMPVDVKDIVTQALKLKSNELDLNKIEVITCISPDLPELSSDPDQLIEVLLNIIDNAQQAMTDANGTGEIKITARRIEDRIRISIKDSGPGIPAGDLARVFHPFFTTKDVGKGTGLGLSISLGIIQQQGGDLWAESAPGNGTTLHIELPVELPVELPANVSPPSGGDCVEGASVEPGAVGELVKRILVVNDELGFRQLLSRALSPGGHLIDLAGGWAEAWTMVQNNSYDCVILNLGLPAVNGMQLFERIRDYDRKLAARCVFITGYLLTPELESSLAATGVPYLTKPFAISHIRRLVLEPSESGSYPEG